MNSIPFDPAARRALPRPDLVQLENQYRGARYADLVERHIRKTRNTWSEAQGYVLAFTEQERKVSERLIDQLNPLGYNRWFWDQDCGRALRTICDGFREAMRAEGETVDDALVFAHFQIVTLNFAYQLGQQKAARKFAGIRKGFFFR